MDYISCVSRPSGQGNLLRRLCACRFPSIRTGGRMMKRNKWGMALAAVGIHLCIGSVYAWSVLTKPVMEDMGLSLSETTWAFSIAILFFLLVFIFDNF